MLKGLRPALKSNKYSLVRPSRALNHTPYAKWYKKKKTQGCDAQAQEAQTRKPPQEEKVIFKLPFRLMFFDIEISSYNLLISTGFIKIKIPLILTLC